MTRATAYVLCLILPLMVGACTTNPATPNGSANPGMTAQHAAQIARDVITAITVIADDYLSSHNEVTPGDKQKIAALITALNVAVTDFANAPPSNMNEAAVATSKALQDIILQTPRDLFPQSTHASVVALQILLATFAQQPVPVPLKT